MIAQLSSGHFDLADALFLIAAILFVIAAFLSAPTANPRPWWLSTLVFIAVGLACVATAFFVS